LLPRRVANAEARQRSPDVAEAPEPEWGDLEALRAQRLADPDVPQPSPEQGLGR
jgi:hypothetical protein